MCRPGTHACNGVCYSDTDAAHCGVACTSCSGAPQNGSAACVAGACTFTCQAGFNKCGNGCVGDSDANACGPSCTVCPGGVANGAPECNVGVCGIKCSTGRYYQPSTSTCNALSVVTVHSQPFTGTVSHWQGLGSDAWVVPAATGINELELRSSASTPSQASPSIYSSSTAFGSLPSLLTAAVEGSNTPRYVAGVGTTVMVRVSTGGFAFTTCTWADPAVQNPLRVFQTPVLSSGIPWSAVESAQAITVARIIASTSNCTASSKVQVGPAGARLWGVKGDTVYYSVGNVMTAKDVTTSSAGSSWTLPAVPDEFDAPFVRVGGALYVLKGAMVKKVADGVVGIGPQPTASADVNPTVNSGTACFRYGDGVRCGAFDAQANTLMPPSLVSAESTDFHSVMGIGPTLFFRTPGGIKGVIVK